MSYKEGALYLNLLLNKRTSSAEIRSYLPHVGKVLIKNIAAHRLYCRIPDWVSRESVSVLRDEKKHPVTMKNGFLYVPSLQPETRIVITFPVRTIKKNEIIQKWNFDILWRGDTIVRMNPTGDKVPLYQREYMNTERMSYRSSPPIPKSENTVHW